jgi:hypothetical protein
MKNLNALAKRLPRTTKRSTLWKFKIALVPLLLFPYIVAFSPNPDSSYTTLEFAAGKGSYARVSRDCSGNVLGATDVPFEDAGISVDHHFSAFRVGAKAGLLHLSEDRSYYGELYDREKTLSYINPNLGLNTKYLGLDFGYVFSDEPIRLAGNSKLKSIPSVNLRIGNLHNWFFSTSWANNLPLMTGGALYDMGIGFHPGGAKSTLWLGVGGFPFDRGVLSVKGGVPLSDKFILNLKGEAGNSGSFQYGLSAGAKITF